MATYHLDIPISDDEIKQLHVGDQVFLSGVMVTGRDAAHSYIIDHFVKTTGRPPSEEAALYEKLKRLLKGSAIYHCGPVVKQDEAGKWHFVAAGPTTSIREEPYQADVMAHFSLKAVIGKGGMAAKTLQGCVDHTYVYLHAVGGAATLIADSVKEVLDVYKKDEFGVPEAFWVIRVEAFPAVVTMDAHGQSIHARVEEASRENLAALIAG
ncbi:MAG: FumA C-terminus/TtdB family hydratase beta subunit [Anaerolineae bacterium]|jgi:fumarate hydratase class I